MLLDTGVPGYAVNVGVIAAIALCAIGFLALVVWLLLRSRRMHEVTGDQQMLDATGELLDAIEADGQSQALVYGERWQVRSEVALPKGARVRVVRRDGLVLWVVPERSAGTVKRD